MFRILPRTSHFVEGRYDRCVSTSGAPSRRGDYRVRCDPGSCFRTDLCIQFLSGANGRPLLDRDTHGLGDSDDYAPRNPPVRTAGEIPIVDPLDPVPLVA